MAFPDRVVATDDFNRASLGANWSAPAGSTIASIVSNQFAASANARQLAFYNVQRYGSSLQVVIDLATSYSVQSIFISPDPATRLDGYVIEGNPNSDISAVYRIAAGVRTVLNSVSITDWNSGHQLGLEYDASTGTINCWHGRSGVWTREATAVDRTYSGPWYVGLWVDWTTQKMDNFQVGTVSAGAQIIPDALAGVSNATLALRATTSVPTATIPARSNATMTLSVPSAAPIPTDSIDAQSNATMTLTVPAGVVAPSSTLIVRELPPLWLAAVATPPASGASVRWGGDEPEAKNRHSDMTISSSIPGGFDTATMQLARDPSLSFPDLERHTFLLVHGAGGRIAGEYRLREAPAVSGDDMSITPAAVGYKAHMEDNNRVSIIFIDRDLGRWTGPSAQRALNLIAGSAPHQADASQSWDTGANVPALVLAVSGQWTSPIPRCEAWYDAGAGNRISEIRAEFTGWPDAAFGLYVTVSDDAVSTTQEQSADVYAGVTSLADFRPTARYRYGRWHWRYDTGGGLDGSTYAIKLYNLRVHGDHNLTQRTNAADGSLGYYLSDMIAYAIRTWCPLLKTTSTSVQPTSYAIQQAAYYDATNVASILDDLSRFGLEDWAVWDNRTFWIYRRGTVGRRWRARVGDARLKEAGPSDERMWNGVIIRFRDTDGSTRTVGPPGSGCDYTDASLQDADPNNPANKEGILRYAPPLDMGGVSVPGAAITVGARFLNDMKELDRSGSAELVGIVEDDKGVLHPAWAVRAGDTITFIDAADTSYRRIVRASYSAETLTTAIDLDAPPERMDAILARLNLAVGDVG